jgi:hypothetical protein
MGHPLLGQANIITEAIADESQGTLRMPRWEVQAGTRVALFLLAAKCGSAHRLIEKVASNRAFVAVSQGFDDLPPIIVALKETPDIDRGAGRAAVESTAGRASEWDSR